MRSARSGGPSQCHALQGITVTIPDHMHATVALGAMARGVAVYCQKTLNWDIWTGRAAEHTYSSKIHPSNWREFLEYGTQMIGDWGIHQLGPANWALQLGNPTSVECTTVGGQSCRVSALFVSVTEATPRLCRGFDSASRSLLWILATGTLQCGRYNQGSQTRCIAFWGALVGFGAQAGCLKRTRNCASLLQRQE